MTARSPIASAVATTKGDDGTTGLLYGGERIAKDDPRAEAYGTIDEAVAALGLARANLGVKRRIGTLSATLGGLDDLILRFQRELFVVGAELATNPDAWDRLADGRTRVSQAMVDDLETTLLEAEAAVTMPSEFVVPGDQLIPYLNRLADLLWVLARAAEGAESKRATPARRAPRQSPQPRASGAAGGNR